MAEAAVVWVSQISVGVVALEVAARAINRGQPIQGVGEGVPAGRKTVINSARKAAPAS